jgi:hypothetical protein
MTTRNDDTPTHPAPIDVLSVQLDAQPRPQAEAQ